PASGTDAARGWQAFPTRRSSDLRVLVPREGGGVQVVVDAWDQVDGNLPRRRLGLHRVGYQVLRADGRLLPGFAAPAMNLDFSRRSEEHTSELQSRENIVCRLLLE